MHELSVISQIVETVIDEAKKNNAKHVDAVQLVIGELAFLGVEQLEFCYQVLSEKEPLLAGSKLETEIESARVK